MRKIFLAFLILCVWTSIAFGGMVIQSVSSGGCASQSYLVEQTTTNGSLDVYCSASKARGQSFLSHASQAQDLYSIIVYLSSEAMEASESDTFEIRVDDDADMSAEYLASKTVTISDGDSAGEIEFIFSAPRHTMVANTTYYFFLQWSRALDDKIQIATNSSSVYADGTMYSKDACDWTASSVASYDLYFKVKVCD